MNKRDVMKADGSSHCLFDLPCPSKVREPLPPPHENQAPLLMRCDVGWIYVKKLSSHRQELSVLWSGMCPLPDSSRPLPSRYPPPLTHRWWPDLIMCHTCDFLWGGLWELAQTRVAGEGQQTVSNSRPWWECLVWGGSQIWLLFGCLCSILS